MFSRFITLFCHNFKCAEPYFDYIQALGEKMTTHHKNKKKYQQGLKECSVQKDNNTSNSHEVDHCNIHIHIKNVDTINIYNCSTSSKTKDEAGTPNRPTDYSDCIPFTEGHKPKQSLQTRLSKLHVNNKVPSVLATTFLHQARRFLAGIEPENKLEEGSFAIFMKLSSSTRKILKCVLERYESNQCMPQLFSPEIEQLWNVPITTEKLTSLVAKELVQRTSVYYFDDPACFDSERPGLLRRDPQGNDDVGIPLYINISAINGLRTNQYLPVLSIGEYQIEEIQQVCTAEIRDDGEIVLNCEQQTDNCPGNNIDGVCLRVPEIQPGEAVLLQGFNYFDVEGKVRLTGKNPSTVVREVNAVVCGDITTGLTETINNIEHVIKDSRVKDQILFTVPVDLPAGIYGIRVIMPLDGDNLVSQEQFIRILSPSTVTYQIASEELKAVNETSPSWFGSDEVGIKTLSTAITMDSEVGAILPNSFKFNDIDSDEKRGMEGVLFQQNNIASVIIIIIGHEIDNDELYEKEVESFEDAFVEVLKSNWAAISGGLGTSGGAVSIALGLSMGWAAAIGGAITLAINLLVAYFGRADLIIEDTITLSALDLETRTNANFPAPEVINYTSSGGIDVTTEALTKDIQYREKRKYISDEEDSEYHITLRYNRIQ